MEKCFLIFPKTLLKLVLGNFIGKPKNTLNQPKCKNLGHKFQKNKSDNVATLITTNLTRADPSEGF
jgi:hypothetical protein